MRIGNRTTGSRLRVVLDPEVALGPGKADLLEGIKATGSISAAGRGMDMSYRRAWGLVEAMNGAFREPLVQTSKGGKAFGGATLTATGEEVLRLYRRMEASAALAIEADFAALRALAKDPPEEK